jgi:tetratricopeptide (TPR) repeat protein
MPHTDARVLGPLLLAGILCVSSPAQNVGPFGKADLGNPVRIEASTKYETAPGTGVLVFRVFAEKTGSLLNGQVQLQLTNLANDIGLAQRIDGDQEGIFPNLQFGSYEIEASALGYLTVHQNVQILATVHAEPIEIVLHRDPAAINLDVSDNVISPKARKEARHAVSLLKSGDFAGAQKHLQTAYDLASNSSDLNFLLGYLYFQKKDYARAASYLSTAAGLSPGNAQALTLLGRANLSQENYPAARSALEQAVLADAENWLPYNLLADSYLREKNYGKAVDEAQIAVMKGQRDGKNIASPAQLVLGQALLGLGRNQEAIQAFDVFLKASPHSPMAYQVRTLVAELKKPELSSTSDGNAKASNVDPSRADPLAAVPAASLSNQSWRPPDIDDIKPILDPRVVCPAAQVLEESGKRVQELVQDLTRFAADEDLFHQSLDAFGFPTRTETRKYDYVAIVSEPKPGAVFIDEYREDKGPQEGYPDAIASTGFVSLALVFHPDMQKDFDFNCEGRTDWHGQTSWLVHFRQRHDRPNRMHSYSIRSQAYAVGLKGRAWITADKFQIAQIQADVVNPVPEIQLRSEHQTVQYGPVPFPKKGTTLWLPKTAEIYFDFREHRYYRRHSFDHYMLFSVDTDEKRKVPESELGSPNNSEEKKAS